METQLLNAQADRIERVLAAHRAPAHVWGGRLTTRTVQFHLTPAATTKLRRLESLTEQVALALGAPSARLTRSGGTLSIEVPLDKTPSSVSLLELDLRLRADQQLRRALAVPGTAVLGLDAGGVPLLLRLSSPDVAHVLIAGTTGSGKTEMARTLIASLILHCQVRDLALALFDPKGHGLLPFARSPQLLFPLVKDPADAITRIQYLFAEMERRDRDHITRPRLVVVIDELADSLQTCGGEFETLLTRLIQRGRSAGISVVACTQKPTATSIGGLLKSNMPVRLVAKVASADDARIAAGTGGTGAERLLGRGDFVLVAGGETIRFQAARVSEDEIKALCESARPATSYLSLVLPRFARRGN